MSSGPPARLKSGGRGSALGNGAVARPTDPAALAAYREAKQAELMDRMMSRKLDALEADYQATVNAKPASQQPVPYRTALQRA
jgi:hypothetical protein